jgi:L-lactate dehydrogenase complex protein LldE
VRISLFIPCYVDQFLPGVGIAMVEVLERLGHEVRVPGGQTCCGQPAFNSGYVDEAKKVARHVLRTFEGSDAVVVPSGSCASMLRVFTPEMFDGDPDRTDAAALAQRTFEFSEFLVDRLGVTDVGAAFPHVVTFHDGCHGLRELGIHAAPRTLLQHVRGLTLLGMDEAATCCGFGGSFSVKFPSVSTAMADTKCESIGRSGAAYVVSNDPSCLMQIAGRLSRRGERARAIHLAEVLNAR